MKKNTDQIKQMHENVKRPIRKTLLIISIALIVALSALAISVSYGFVATIVRRENSDRLSKTIEYVEKHVDVEDLRECKETGVKSEKYAELQQFLNEYIDQIDLSYIYIVVPTDKGLINVIASTSQEERDAGETEDMELLYLEENYSKKELRSYLSAYKKDGITCFQETSEVYGTYFTAAKTLKDGAGNSVALLCADIDIEALRTMVARMMIVITVSVVIGTILFAGLVTLLIRKNVTKPLFAMEKSAREFANAAKENEDITVTQYASPDVHTGNEVQSLAEAIDYMANSLKENAQKAVEATRRVSEAEQENARLEERAKSAERIAKLSESVTALLDNMPAMTFYKEIETGKYLMCNQSFAEYCHKKDPNEVIGLTDYDLFDKSAAAHFIQCDRDAMEKDEPYVFFEDVPDATGARKQFQTTKLKFTDTNGVTRLLGMCVDVTEMMKMQTETIMVKAAYEEAKNESLTYSRIASALSKDYVYLYYVNIGTGEFYEYRSGSGHENLTLERKGEDFFRASLADAQKRIFKDDRDIFTATFNRENVLEKIATHGVFTMTYRLISDGKPTYVNMKATQLKDDEEHIIIGVNDVDAQMKDQEELKRIAEERITYSRITALSGDYICIYTVDPETDEFIEYSVTEAYEGLGLEKAGKEFFEKSREESKRAVYEADRDRLVNALTKENVMKEIGENGIFAIDYRLMIQGKPTYVMLKAALVEEKDGPQLIVGVSNIDATVKREEAYAHDLSAAKKQADSDALTGVKNKHAYIDVEGQLNKEIDEGKKVAFSIAIFDVNGLKVVNDNKGHVAGDEHIKKACRMICDVFKHSPVFRIGGDEFAVIAQGEDYENMDALIALIEEINRKNAAAGEVTIACGTAKYHKDKDVSTVFKRADASMYKNKRNQQKRS